MEGVALLRSPQPSHLWCPRFLRKRRRRTKAPRPKPATGRQNRVSAASLARSSGVAEGRRAGDGVKRDDLLVTEGVRDR